MNFKFRWLRAIAAFVVLPPCVGVSVAILLRDLQSASHLVRVKT